MPQRVFGERTFATGFFSIVLAFLMMLIFSIVIWFAELVPFVGIIIGIVALVLGVFAGMFVDACIMRMAVVDRFGAAWEFSDVWAAYRSNLGSLFCASVLPGLVVGVVGTLVVLLLSLVMTLIGLSATSMMFGMDRGAMAGVIGVYAIVVLVGGYATLVAAALTTTLKYRALGHWAARVAPAWANAYAHETGAYGSYGGYGEVSPTSGPACAPVPPAPVPVAAPAPVPAPAPSHAPTWDDTPSVMLGSSAPHANDGETTDLAHARGAEESVAAPTLTLRRQNGESLSVTSFPATVGKGSAANVCIGGNGSISRVHVRVSQAGSALVVEDLGSTNGTYLNGDVIQEGEIVTLQDGDLLRLGDEELVVHL